MWALVPVKRFTVAKARLSAALPLPERVALTRLMLQDVLGVLSRAHCVERIVVLTNEPTIGDLPGLADTEIWPDRHEGNLNAGLAAAAAKFPAGCGRVLILPADVPAVDTTDVETLARIHREGIVLAPAVIDAGTNALLSVLPLPIEPQFGPGSLAAHLAIANQRRVGARVFPCLSLARDIDRPEDLEWLAESRSRCLSCRHLRHVLRRRTEPMAI